MFKNYKNFYLIKSLTLLMHLRHLSSHMYSNNLHDCLEVHFYVLKDLFVIHLSHFVFIFHQFFLLETEEWLDTAATEINIRAFSDSEGRKKSSHVCERNSRQIRNILWVRICKKGRRILFNLQDPYKSSLRITLMT